MPVLGQVLSTSEILGNMVLSANTSIPAGNTVANTTTETAFASSGSIPANTLAAGSVVRIKLWGTYGTTVVSPNLTGKLKIGSQALLNTGALSAAINLSNAGWFADASIVVQSIGGSGVIDAQGFAEFASAATTGLSVNVPNTSTFTVDTTTTQAITVTIQWSAANAANTITLRQMIVEVLNP